MRQSREGVDVGQLLDQLLGYFRDLMVSVAGCPADTLALQLARGTCASWSSPGRQLGLESILAMMQIIDQAIARLRYSMHPRALAELAIGPDLHAWNSSKRCLRWWPA